MGVGLRVQRRDQCAGEVGEKVQPGGDSEEARSVRSKHAKPTSSCLSGRDGDLQLTRTVWPGHNLAARGVRMAVATCPQLPQSWMDWRVSRSSALSRAAGSPTWYQNASRGMPWTRPLGMEVFHTLLAEKGSSGRSL